VAKALWKLSSWIAGKHLATDFEPMVKFWLCEKNLKCLTVFTSAVLWTIWKTRKDICLQGRQWIGMKMVFGRCARMLRNWRLLKKLEDNCEIGNLVGGSGESKVVSIKFTLGATTSMTEFQFQVDLIIFLRLSVSQIM
jgi:hypothetical protein